MSLRPTLPLGANMGLRHPRGKLPKIFPRPLPSVSYPNFHPLRSQYPNPAVHHVSRAVARATDYTTPESHGPATHFRIQLKRSPIGMPKLYDRTLGALGLRKKDRIAFFPFSETRAGQILRVKELVEVRNVSWWQMEDEMKRGKGEAPGMHLVDRKKLEGKRFGRVGEAFEL